ncbi:MAG: ABC transporter permease [Ostreibacterium sp.]
MINTDIKLLWRDWRGGQLNLVLSALILAVTVVTAVSLLANRVELGLKEQISSFLAADLAIRGGVVIDDAYRQAAEERQLNRAETATFRSIVFVGDRHHLASTKAVSAGYPLLGELLVTPRLTTEQSQPEIMRSGPPSGEVWVAPRLLPLLGIKLGETIEIGYSKLNVTRLIINEPDSGSGFAMSGARVMMSMDDLPKTGLVGPASRITYSLLLSGEASAINDYEDWFESYKAISPQTQHLRLIRPENSEQRLDEALARGQSFLLLSGMVGVLLAGLALAIASRRYADRLTSQVALLKSWGQSTRSVRISYIIRLAIIALFATVIGMLIGWGVHFLLLGVANSLFAVALPSAGLHPWLVAAATGVICVLGFALPAMWHLPTIAPLRVLRRDIPSTMMGQGRRLAIGLVALIGLILWYSGDVLMSAMFVFVLLVLFSLCALVALQALKLTQRFGQWRGSVWRLGLANLWRRRNQTLVQLVAFSVTIMLLLIMVSLRTSLIQDWQKQLPERAPNHFLVNVASNEIEPINAILSDYAAENITWFPLVRGRLVKINSEIISDERIQQADGLNREVNFTWSATLPANNVVSAGQWWPENITSTAGEHQFSMEKKAAESLGVNIGDVVQFSLGGRQLSAKLTSLREVDWQSMTPNFFVIFSPGTLDDYLPTWMTSVYVDIGDDATKKGMLTNAILVQYPTVLVIELGDIIDRIKNLMEHVTKGLEMILTLVLACGTLVLFAAIGVSFDERLHESAILRTLGSAKRVILGALTVEFVTLGIIAGFIASLGAEVVLFILQKWVFNMTTTWHSEVWLLGVPLSIVLIGGLGVWRSQSIVKTSPLESLRHLQQ